MNSLFVDTAGWASFFIQTEPTHSLALQLLAAARQKNHSIITSNYILLELVTLLYSPLRASSTPVPWASVEVSASSTPVPRKSVEVSMYSTQVPLTSVEVSVFRL